MRTSALLVSIASASLAAVAVPSIALACGGGVTSEGATITVGQHVAYYAVGAERTEVVLQLALPEVGDDFGVIVPVPGEPVLDDEAIEPTQLSGLDAFSTPQIVYPEDEGGGEGSSSSGCGCGDGDEGGSFDGGGSGGGGDGGDGVDVQQVADIGPITAISFAAEDGDALTAWLEENGFSIPAEQLPIVQSYVRPGTSFIAFKRNAEVEPEAGATSVGVHFSLAGDQRSYPLKMAAMGAAEEIGFRIYVAVPGGAGAVPAAPFAALTLGDLDRGLIASEGYTAAVRVAVADRGGKAFVVEGIYGPETNWRDNLGLDVAAFTPEDATLSRLTSIMPRATLDTDVAFTGSLDAAPSSVELSTYAALGRPRPVPIQWGSVGVSVGAMIAAVVRRVRRRARG
jgi:hypothetical protein